jgi:heme a synthase
MQGGAPAAERDDEQIGTSILNRDAPRASISGSARVPLARFAWFVLAYNIAAIIWGAYVRATGSGAGCGSQWPLCNGQFLPRTPQTHTVIEFTHRVTSGVSLVLVVMLLIWCWRRTAKGHWPRYSAVAAAVLLSNEALLGAVLVFVDHLGGSDRSATHALFLCVHFGNTLLLLAALALAARWLSNRDRRFAVVPRPYLTMATALGLVSVMLIGPAGSLASLGDTIFPADSLRHGFLQDFASNSPTLLRLRVLHPIAAVIGTVYVL